MPASYLEQRLRPLGGTFLELGLRGQRDGEDTKDERALKKTWALHRFGPSSLRRRHSIGGHMPHGIASLDSPQLKVSRSPPQLDLLQLRRDSSFDLDNFPLRGEQTVTAAVGLASHIVFVDDDDSDVEVFDSSRAAGGTEFGAVHADEDSVQQQVEGGNVLCYSSSRVAEGSADIAEQGRILSSTPLRPLNTGSSDIHSSALRQQATPSSQLHMVAAASVNHCQSQAASVAAVGAGSRGWGSFSSSGAASPGGISSGAPSPGLVVAAQFEAWPDTDDEMDVPSGSPCTWTPAVARSKALGGQPVCASDLSSAAACLAGETSRHGAADGSRALRNLPLSEVTSKMPLPGMLPAKEITTLMVRNLPPTLSQLRLMQELDSTGFAGVYDFLYMPSSFEARESKGYAFINMISASAAGTLAAMWHGSHRFANISGGCGCGSISGSPILPLNISPAIIQGLEANLHKWVRMSRVRDPSFRPFVRGKTGTSTPASTPSAVSTTAGSTPVPHLTQQQQQQPVVASELPLEAGARPTAAAFGRFGVVPFDDMVADCRPPQVRHTLIASLSTALGVSPVEGRSLSSSPMGGHLFSSPSSLLGSALGNTPFAGSLNVSPMASPLGGPMPTGSTLLGGMALGAVATQNRALATMAGGIEEGVTTLMVRNLPREFLQQDLLEELDRCGFVGLYDFVYMPCSFEARESKGYAFINFTSPSVTQRFAGEWQRSRRFSSEAPPVNISAATVQGLEANSQKWAGPRMTRIRNPALRPFVRDFSGAVQH